MGDGGKRKEQYIHFILYPTGSRTNVDTSVYINHVADDGM